MYICLHLYIYIYICIYIDYICTYIYIIIIYTYIYNTETEYGNGVDAHAFPYQCGICDMESEYCAFEQNKKQTHCYLCDRPVRHTNLHRDRVQNPHSCQQSGGGGPPKTPGFFENGL